jgi:hypothetical protein
MAKPVLAVENFFSRTQFGLHAIDASHAIAGNEAFRVATGRRHPDRNSWLGGTNAESWLRVQCDQSRSADFIAIDRNSTLLGEQVFLEKSANGTTGWTTVISPTIPTAAAYDTSLDAANGALTWEGAWVKRFTADSSVWWRLRIPALGAGIAARVVGLYLGASWELPYYLEKPFDDQSIDTRFDEVESDTAWVGASRVRQRRSGQLHIKLSAASDFPTARYTTNHFSSRRPMWIIHDSADASLAVLAMSQQGKIGWMQEEGWFHRQARVPWVEHEPKPNLY